MSDLKHRAKEILDFNENHFYSWSIERKIKKLIKDLTEREEKLVKAIKAIRHSLLYGSLNKEHVNNIIQSIDSGLKALNLEGDKDAGEA